MNDMRECLAFVKYSCEIKLIKAKWVISFMVLSLFPLYCLGQLAYLSVASGTRSNLWDLIFYQFGTYMNLYLLIFPMYIFLISDLARDQGMENYLFVRLGSKACWLRNKLIILFLFTLLYLSISVLLCGFAGIFSLNLERGWSETALEKHSLANITYFNQAFIGLPPYALLTVLLGLIFLSLLAQGCFLLYLHLYLKKSVVPFMVGIIGNFAVLVLLKADHMWKAFALLPYKRILLQYQTLDFSVVKSTGVGFSALYWCTLISGLIFIIFWKLKSVDLISEVENEK